MRYCSKRAAVQRLCPCLILLLLSACAGARPPAAGTPATAQDVRDTERMAAGHAHDTPTATPAATTPPAVATTEERVSYGQVGGAPVYGYLARPARSRAKDRLPALIVIHEWWGLNENVRNEARRLAAEGYETLAVDLYAGQVATQPPEALKLMMAVTKTPGPAEENLRQAYAYLKKTAGAPRVASIGWCFGGQWSLRTALLLPQELDAAVIYYGSVNVPEADLATLQMPILGNFAAQDRIISVDSVKTFEATMKRLGKSVDVRIFEGAEHAFANPSGTAYQAAAAEESWKRTLAFLKRNLQKRSG
jgi:carboxymethylenebutenolidase